MWRQGQPYKIVLFYKYSNISEEFVQEIIIKLNEVCESNGIVGRLLIATEGINGNLAASNESIDLFIKYFEESFVSFGVIDWKFDNGIGNFLPFRYLMVKKCKEIVSSGSKNDFIGSNIRYDKDTFGGLIGTGQHLKPEDFHEAILHDDNALIVDIRNQYEYDIGHFQNARNLETFTYSETWSSLDKLFNKKVTSIEETEIIGQKQKPIYMYCTGGIRCEKASAYLVAKGYENVFQLQGGIHRYLETFPDGGLFRGKNFVFDTRVSIPTESKAISSEITGNEVESTSTSTIGKCIDCNIDYDVFRGDVMCTVCRIPLLVCQQCIDTNKYPSEYYCQRHRQLKYIYFSIIESFTIDELNSQISNLFDVLKLPQYEQTRSNRSRRKTILKQIERLNLRIDELKISNSIGDCAQSVDEITKEPKSLKNPKNRENWGFWRDHKSVMNI